MPLLYHINEIDLSILIWHIQEEEFKLKENIILHLPDSKKLAQLKHPCKRREFLALRQCLNYYYGQNPKVFYTSDGKPYLETKENISFSHTHGFASMIVSKTLKVGIDLEIFRKGIKRATAKFMRKAEFDSLDENKLIEHLIQYWGAKEVVVKIEGTRRLHFKKDIIISPFAYKPEQESTGELINGSQRKLYELRFSYIKPLIITYGWRKE